MKKLLYSSILLFLIFSCKKTETETVPVTKNCGNGFTSLSGFCIDNSGTNYYGYLNFHCYVDSIAFSFYKSNNFDSNLIFRHITNKPIVSIGGQNASISNLGQIICPNTTGKVHTILVKVNDVNDLILNKKDLPISVYLEEFFDNNTKYIDSTKLVLKQR